MSSQDPIKINKNDALPHGMDFLKLKKEGIELAQELSGDIWTDYNEHDPGVTILENQVYALTELSYKTSFPVEDYFFSNPNITKDTDHLFYPLQNIMVSSPLTPKDYRKLIIDQIAEVRNAWVIPKTQSDVGFDMKGLYQIYLQIDETVDQQTVVNEVFELLAANRNLGEDFEKPKILESKKIVIQANVQIQSDLIGEVILANILLKLSELLNPTISFFTMEELVQMGYAYEEIFQGPLPKNGFITDKDLEKSDIGQINKLYRSKIVQSITQVDGVMAVMNMDVLVDNVLINSELIMLENQTFPQLDIENILSKSDNISLIVGDIPYSLDLDLVTYTLDLLQSKEKQSHKRWLDFKVYEQSSERRSDDISYYYSIQNTFPLVYGIGEFGVALKPNMDEYSAYAKQLKAYISPMDQVMANFLAQLTNVPKLLSIDRNIEKTYFSQLVTSASDMDKINMYPPDQQSNNLENLVGEFDNYLYRRNRFLDHLLARFGEEFLSEAYHSIHRESTSISKDDFSKATIDAKMKFLENYVDISSNRSKGYNYLKSYFDKENTSVLKKKVSLMFNIQEYGTKRLGNNSLDTSTKTKQSNYKIGNASSFTFCSNQENVIAEALAYGTSRLHYDIQLIEKERYEIYFVHPINKEKYAIYQGKSLLECEEALKKLLQKFKQINQDSEGFHLIEHVLLRPQYNGNQLVLTNKINQLLFAKADIKTNDWEKQLLQFGAEKINYKANKVDQGFFVQLIDNKSNVIAESRELATKKIAESSIVECIKTISKAKTDPIASKLDIINEALIAVGVNQSIDPYSLKISVIIPNWSGRFLQDKMRTIFENIVRLNSPAHLSIDFYWLSPQQMLDFEKLYFNFLDLKFSEKSSPSIDHAAYKLSIWLRSTAKPNNKELKNELIKLNEKG